MTVTTEHDWMVDKIIRLQYHQDQEYQILEEIGRGSFGALYLGQSLGDNAYVAVKVVSNKEGALEYREREIDIQTSLKHPNILTLLGTSTDLDHTYMVMDLCAMGDLFDHLSHCKLSHVQVTMMFGQVLDAVDYMHQHNVYHRDLKLENILLYGNDDDAIIFSAEDLPQQWTIKVADFGLSTRERYNTERGCGSTPYLGPEHFFDNAVAIIDAAASDVWSLGILLSYMVFGCHLWQEASTKDPLYCRYLQDSAAMLKQAFPQLSQDLYHFLVTVLAPSPVDRPSVREMKERFASIRSYHDDTRCWPLQIVTCSGSGSGGGGGGGIGGGRPNPFYKATTAPAAAADPLQDSAVFSDSEMMMIPVDQKPQEEFRQPSLSKFTANDDQEETMFVHQHESAWWL